MTAPPEIPAGLSYYVPTDRSDAHNLQPFRRVTPCPYSPMIFTSTRFLRLPSNSP